MSRHRHWLDEPWIHVVLALGLIGLISFAAFILQGGPS